MLEVDDPGFARTFTEEMDRVVAEAKQPLAPPDDTAYPDAEQTGG
jgi:hypothetical protein